MNLALVIERLSGGGAERLVVQLARGMQARGQRVCVYALQEAGAEGEALRRQ